MTVLIREPNHEPYLLATFLATAKSDPWRAAKTIFGMLAIIALIGGLLWVDQIAEWVGRMLG